MGFGFGFWIKIYDFGCWIMDLEKDMGLSREKEKVAKPVDKFGITFCRRQKDDQAVAVSCSGDSNAVAFSLRLRRAWQGKGARRTYSALFLPVSAESMKGFC